MSSPRTGILSLIRFNLGQNWETNTSTFLAGWIKSIILGTYGGGPSDFSVSPIFWSWNFGLWTLDLGLTIVKLKTSSGIVIIYFAQTWRTLWCHQWWEPGELRKTEGTARHRNTGTPEKEWLKKGWGYIFLWKSRKYYWQTGGWVMKLYKNVN